MADSKHNAVWEWLMECPMIRNMFFNFSQSDLEDTVLIPSDSIVERYIDGSTLRHYDVELVRFMPVSFDANDAANITVLMDVEALAEWVEQQNDARNFPEFPPGEAVQEITAMPSESGYVAAQDGNRAKYMIPLQIEYVKEAKIHG